MEKRTIISCTSFISMKTYEKLDVRNSNIGRNARVIHLFDFIRAHKSELERIAKRSLVRRKKTLEKKLVLCVKPAEGYTEEFEFFAIKRMYADLRDIFCDVYYGISSDPANILKAYECTDAPEDEYEDLLTFVRTSQAKGLSEQNILEQIMQDAQLLEQGKDAQEKTRFDWSYVEVCALPRFIGSNGLLCSCFSEYLIAHGLPLDRAKYDKGKA